MNAPFRYPGLALATALLLPAGLSAQSGPFDSAPAPAAAATPAAKPAQQGVIPSGPTSLESNTLIQIIDRAFDTKSDSINPEDGTMVWKGKTYNIGQFRAFRARFERYLALPATNDSEIHQAIVAEIENLLSTRAGDEAGTEIKKAWQLLYRASEYNEDGGASIAIANQVFNAWRIRDEKEAYRITQIELERIRRQQQGSVSYSGDLLVAEGVNNATDVAGQLANSGSSSGSTNSSGTSNSGNTNSNATGSVSTGGTNGTTVSGSAGNKSGTNNKSNQAGSAKQSPSAAAAGTVSQFFRVRELAETESRIKASEAGSLLTATQAKLQFQTQIVGLFLSRRYQHCLIASNFYRYIFKGSAQRLEVGRKELADYFPDSDLAVTVEALESLSREAMNDVNASMQAITLSYDDGQLINALERLQETFFIGEYVPSVAQFDRTKKQVLLDLYRKIDTARKLSDLKDYEAVSGVVTEIGDLTKDFRANEINSAIRSAQRMSTLALHAARQAVMEENFVAAQAAVERAAQLWPLNPAIETYTENLASQVNAGSQAAKLFDDAMKRNDQRRIFDQRSELGIGLINDPVRANELKVIVERMSRLEIYLIQAKELIASNNSFGAWEALVAATPLAPDDVELNQRKAALAPRVANFVGRLDQATRYEDDDQYAASLTQYLAAQALYPPSSIARTGIERVSKALLSSLTDEVDAAAAAAVPATADAGK